MSRRTYVPDRGDIVWLQFNPQAGHEQAGHRPALVLSPASYNRLSGLMLCCPMTSHKKGYPFEVPLPAGQAVAGVVLADQIKNIDWQARKAVLASRVPDAVLIEVRERLRPLLGL